MPAPFFVFLGGGFVAVLGGLACATGWFCCRGRGLWWLPLCGIAAWAVDSAGAVVLPLCFVLGCSAACDLREMEVPDLPWWVACAGWLLFGGVVPRPVGLAGAVLALVFGLFVWFVGTRLYGEAAYGGADVKLGAVAGLYLGVSGFLLALLLGSLFGLAHGLWLRRGGKLGPRQPFPFIPALGMGVLAAASVLPLWEHLLQLLAQ